MAEENAVLMYKNRPLMRKDNIVYYGSMADSHIVMLQILETKKAAAFSLTYTDGNFLYIAIGAGKQPTGGYSYQIHGLWLADNVIVIDTELLGPSTDEQAHKVASYPFVVVKLEHRDEPVVFK